MDSGSSVGDLFSSFLELQKQDSMRLAAFIRENSTQIIDPWEKFARTLIPAAHGMSPLDLRDHIVEILAFIADDIESTQTEFEQAIKSEGKKAGGSKASAAETHAALRQAGGFSMEQMVSEYRALRASVIKLWGAQWSQPTGQDLFDLIRFNESMDQVISESISFYSEKLDYSRELFLGILSHDLRNPLGAMLMSAQLALKIGPLNERQAMLVSQVISSGGRATEILDHLLDLTRARLGSGMNVIRQRMDFAFISRQMVDEMRTMHPGRDFKLEISGQTEGEWDKPRIGQVFSNLLDNAVQYGFKDSPIGVTIKGDPEVVILSVHNDGVPIPLNVLGEIFGSLARGEAGSSDQPKETHLGLGLYITKEIVSAHGGTITVTSSEKNGTAFIARFPRFLNHA